MPSHCWKARIRHGLRCDFLSPPAETVALRRSISRRTGSKGISLPDNIYRQSRRTFGRRRRGRRGTDHHTKGLERRRNAASPAQSPRADGREVPRRGDPDESSQRPLLHRVLLPTLRPAALCGHPEEGRACTDRLLDRGCPAPSLLLLRGHPPVPRLGDEPARKQRAALRRGAARQRDHERPPGVRGRFGVGRFQGDDRPRARRFRVGRRGLRHHAPAPGQVGGGDRPHPPGSRDLRGWAATRLWRHSRPA